MKPPEKSNLLKEILTGDELADFRQSSLEQSLNALRQQQRRRHVVRIGTTLLLPLLFLLVIRSRQAVDTSTRFTSANPTAPTLPTPAADDRATKFITDDELFALFPNRSMALVGRPGQQQLVFLDQTEKSRQP